MSFQACMTSMLTTLNVSQKSQIQILNNMSMNKNDRFFFSLKQMFSKKKFH